MLELIDIHSLFNSAFICKINCFLSARSHIFNAIESITTFRFGNYLRTDRSQRTQQPQKNSHFSIELLRNNGRIAYLILLHRNQSLFWFNRLDAEKDNCSFNTLQNVGFMNNIPHRSIAIDVGRRCHIGSLDQNSIRQFHSQIVNTQNGTKKKAVHPELSDCGGCFWSYDFLLRCSHQFALPETCAA